MNKPVFRVVGLDHATCDDAYFGDETSTEPTLAVAATRLSIYQPVEPETVTIRLCDMMPTLQRSASAKLAWVNDFAEDPVVITKDLYEVLLTFQRLNKAA